MSDDESAVALLFFVNTYEQKEERKILNYNTLFMFHHPSSQCNTFNSNIKLIFLLVIVIHCVRPLCLQRLLDWFTNELFVLLNLNILLGFSNVMNLKKSKYKA